MMSSADSRSDLHSLATASSSTPRSFVPVTASDNSCSIMRGCASGAGNMCAKCWCAINRADSRSDLHSLATAARSTPRSFVRVTASDNPCHIMHGVLPQLVARRDDDGLLARRLADRHVLKRGFAVGDAGHGASRCGVQV